MPQSDKGGDMQFSRLRSIEKESEMKHSSLREALFTKLRVAPALLLLAIATGASAQITPIYNFSKTGDPQNPQLVGVIAQGRDGNMYSTAPYRVPNVNLGTAFKITAGGKLTVVYDFKNQVAGGLTLGTDGNFYGTTEDGGTGYGTAFKLTPGGALKTLYTFTGGNDGGQPLAPPIEGSDGNFYGTTNKGGIDGYGTVYEMTPAGELTPLLSFSGGDGAYPTGPLVQAADGSFWGTTSTSSNANGPFVVFKLTASGHFTYNVFPSAFVYSDAGLVQGNDGNFYGTTYTNINGYGFVFRITPEGSFKVLYYFSGGSDGANPYAGLVLATDGNFYGVTANAGDFGFGTVYKITPKGTFSVVESLNGTDGAYPEVTLIQHTNGILYGDAKEGGKTTNYGTFFDVNLGLKPYARLLPASGKVGATIGVLGQGFTGTTKVTFNGIAAKFKVVSTTYLTAVVPPRATTGFVSVITPKGTLKSNAPFRVP
jgi:uncharacterized repeat protein (TIGR03803 family)